MKRSILWQVRSDCNAVAKHFMKRTQDPGKPQLLPLWLAVLACVVVDAAMLLLVRERMWPQAPGIVGVGLALGQVSLLGAWLVWGRWNAVWRVVLVAAAVYGISFLGSHSTDGPGNSSEWYGILLFYLAMLFVVFLISRLMGYRLTSGSSGTNQTAAVAGQRPTQFSIWGLLSVTTAVGIVLTLLRFVDLPFLWDFEPIIFFLILTISSSVILFASFLPQWAVAVGVAVTVCPIAGLLMALNGLPNPNEWRELIAMNLIHGTCVLCGVSVAKIAGYRLSRPINPQATAAASETTTLKSPDQPAEP